MANNQFSPMGPYSHKVISVSRFLSAGQTPLRRLKPRGPCRASRGDASLGQPQEARRQMHPEVLQVANSQQESCVDLEAPRRGTHRRGATNSTTSYKI